MFPTRACRACFKRLKTAYLRVHGDHRGTTLMELMVTMVLMMLFIGGTGATIARGYEIYLRVRAMNESVQVSDMILDKIASELEGAINSNSDTVTILSGGHTVSFANANGSQMSISTMEKEEGGSGEIGTGRGFLLVNYKKTNDYGEMHWMFDEASYLGLEITELKFEFLSPGRTVANGEAIGADPGGNVVRTTVSLSGDYGQYTNVRYIRCYNFEARKPSATPTLPPAPTPEPTPEPTPTPTPEPTPTPTP